jgi:hypothetical protein
VPAVVDMLADTVLRPKFLPWELEEEKAAVKAELDAAAKNPQVDLGFLLWAVRYFRTEVGGVQVPGQALARAIHRVLNARGPLRANRLCYLLNLGQ